MERLVYSPKAFVYVMSDTPSPISGNTQAPYIHNLSDLVVSGSVSRRLNQVSTAEVTFQNPNRMFTQPGNPVFRPMDRITIFLQRLPGCPVQAFTGYLDETPYYQMYPGTCSIKASCTLKRLQHTYFDPGLPFMMTFMAKYGWVTDNQGGILKAEDANEEIVRSSDATDDAATGDQKRDSSISELLFATMKHIGGWDEDELIVEQLPEKLIERIKKIYTVLEERNEAADADFQEFLKNFLGAGSIGGGAAGDGTVVSTGTITGANKIIPVIVAAANQHGIPPEMAVNVCLMETGLGQDMLNEDSGAAGYYQWTQSSFGPSLDRGAPGSYQKCGHPLTLKFSQNSDLGISAGAFCKCAALTKSKFGASQLRQWAMYIQGVNEQNNPLYGPTDWNKNMAVAKALIAQHGGANNNVRDAADNEPTGSPRDAADSVVAGRAADGREANLTEGQRLHTPIKNVSEDSNGYNPPGHDGIDLICPERATVYAVCKAEVIDARAGGWWGQGNPGGAEGARGDGIIRLKTLEDIGEMRKGTIIGYGHAEAPRVAVGDIVEAGDVIGEAGLANAWHIHFFAGPPGSDARDGEMDVTPLWHAFRDGEAPSGVDGGASGDSGGTGFSDSLRDAKAGALLSTFNFPAAFNQAESILLNGDKSLMNDQPLLPFIEELVKGSMRNFMSLPNGKFYAFHPDYFGSFGSNPYWEIDDIEILDGNITLTDAALATHVYIVGQTLPDDKLPIDIAQKINTAGVVNVWNAGAADFLNADPEGVKEAHKKNRDSKDKDKKKESELEPFLGDPQAVKEFLNRYGARPVVQQATFIRSHLFETFYAFQTFMLLWARQFLTPFTFTFMPELYTGGIVAFPNHGIQCFIDEVHHSFDYQGGFTTQANLSAPAALGTEPNAISKGMVRSGVLSTLTDTE